MQDLLTGPKSRRRRRPGVAPPAILALGVAAALLAGCVPGGPASGGGSAGGTGSASGGASAGGSPQSPPPFGGGGTRPNPIRPPPAINDPGPTTPPPSSQLPPPRSSLQMAADIERRYPFRVTGAGANEANLTTLERALEDFRPDQLTRLRLVNFPLVQGQQGLQGLWQSDGFSSEIHLYAQTGRPRQVDLHTVTHEFGHHFSLLSQKSWGDRYDAALGRGYGAYPSSYSRTQDAEKVAENMAFSLLGGESESRPLASWRPSAAAKQLLQERFGARVKVR